MAFGCWCPPHQPSSLCQLDWKVLSEHLFIWVTGEISLKTHLIYICFNIFILMETPRGRWRTSEAPPIVVRERRHPTLQTDLLDLFYTSIWEKRKRRGEEERVWMLGGIFLAEGWWPCWPNTSHLTWPPPNEPTPYFVIPESTAACYRHSHVFLSQNDKRKNILVENHFFLSCWQEGFLQVLLKNACSCFSST